ncbi:MAG: ribosome maturation factor RimP [Myxococcaceae bacterium]
MSSKAMSSKSNDSKKNNARQDVEAKVIALCEPLIAAEGLELLDLEFVREHTGWVLRLFIDKPGAQVGVDECAIASRAVDKALDVEDVIPHEYNLEVSSPGLNRPLKKQAHFAAVKGQQVRIKTFGPLFEPPRKNFLGTLSDVSADAVTVEVEGAGPFTIPLKDIARANLEFQP